MIAGALEIQLMADVARLRADMDAGRRTVEDATTRMGRAAGLAKGALGAIAGVLSVAAFAGWIKGAIDMADATSKLSQKTGVAVQDIAGMKLAYDLGGAGGEAFSGSMSKLSKAITEGNKGLSAMGIKTQDTAGQLRSNKDVMYDVADAISKMDGGARKTAMAMEIFGKSGADLIPLLNGGSDGFRQMDEMARKLGLTIDDKTAKSAEAFNDNLDLLAMGSKGVATGIAAQLLPTLTALTGSFLESMTSGDKMARTADIIGTGLKILYTIALGIIEIFSTLGKVVGGVAAFIGAQISGMQASFQAVGQALKGDFSGAFDTLGAAARNSVGVVTAAGADIADGWKSTGKAFSDAWSSEGNAMVEAQTKIARAEKDRLAQEEARAAAAKKAQAESAAAAKKAQGEYDQAMKAGANLIESLRIEAEQIGKSADEIKLMNAARAAGKIPSEEMRKQVLAMTAANIEAVRVQTLVTAGEKAAAKIEDDLHASLSDATKGIDDQIKSMRQQIAVYGLTEQAVIELSLREAEAARAGVIGNMAKSLALDEQIAKWKELLSLAGQKSTNEAGKKLADENLAAQKSMWDSIDQTAHDTFVSIFDSGKNAFDRLKDTLKNGLLDMLYQMTIKKWIVSISASTTGVGAMAAPGGGLGAAGIAGGPTGGMIAGLFGAGGMAGSLAAGAGWLTGATTLGGSLTAGASLIASGTMAGGLAGAGMVVGALAPIALGIGAIVAVGKALFGMKSKEMGATTLNGSFGASGFTGSNDTAWTQKGGWLRSDKSGVNSAAIDAAMAAQFTSGYDALKTASADFAKALGVNADSIAGRSQAMSIVLTKDEAENKKAIAAFFTGVADDMARELIPSLDKFTVAGESASTTLQRIASNYASLDQIMKSLSMTFGAIGLESIEARERLVSLSGGIEAMAQQAQGFAQNFMSEAERLAPVQKHVADELAAMGLAGVTTREQFKSIVLGLTLTDEKGAQTYARLMKIQEAFAMVTPAAQDAAVAIAALAAEEAQRADAMAAQAKALSTAQVAFMDRMNQVKVSAAPSAPASNEMDAAMKNFYTVVARRQVEAAAQIKTSWTSLTGSIFDEVQRIRGVMVGTGATGFANVQAQFAMATAQARAGDQGAAAMLPKLSQSLIELAQSQATSAADLQRVQGRTAASLYETGVSTSARYGIPLPPSQSSSAGQGDLASVLNKLTSRIEEQDVAMGKIASNTQRFADTLDVLTEGGTVMRVKTDTPA